MFCCKEKQQRKICIIHRICTSVLVKQCELHYYLFNNRNNKNNDLYGGEKMSHNLIMLRQTYKGIKAVLKMVLAAADTNISGSSYDV